MKGHTFLNNIYFILLGFLVFSPMSNKIVLDVIGLPLSMPELLLVPFFLVPHNKLRSIRIKGSDIFATGMLLILLIAIGLVMSNFSLYSMLSTSRAWFYLIVLTLAFSRDNDITTDDFMYLSLGSVLAWLIISRSTFATVIAQSITDQNEMETYGVMMVVPVLIAASFSKSRYFVMILAIILVFAISIFSGTRRLMIVALMSFVVSLFLILRKRHSKGAMLIVLGLVTLLIVIIPIIMSFVEDNASVLYYRIFGRVEDALENGELTADGDIARKRAIDSFFNNLENYIIPHGMVSTRTGTDGGFVGLFIDFPLFQLSWIYGIPVVFLLLVFFVRKLLINIKKYMINLDDVSFVSIVVLIVAFMLLFVEASYIVFPESAPITGALLGLTIRNAKSMKLIYK